MALRGQNIATLQEAKHFRIKAIMASPQVSFPSLVLFINVCKEVYSYVRKEMSFGVRQPMFGIVQGERLEGRVGIFCPLTLTLTVNQHNFPKLSSCSQIGHKETEQIHNRGLLSQSFI